MEAAVFIPGLGGSPRSYEGVLPALWRRGSVLFANQMSEDTISAIAARILQHAPPRFLLAGHSFGGYVAFEVLRQAPERVTQLVLLNTSARPESDEAREKRLAQINEVEQGGYDAVGRAQAARVVHTSRADDKALQEKLLQSWRDSGKEAYLHQQRAIMERADSRPLLGSIAIPTLVLTGEGDQVIPPAMSKEIADGIPGASLTVIEKSGHFPAMEQPESVKRALEDWLGV